MTKDKAIFCVKLKFMKMTNVENTYSKKHTTKYGNNQSEVNVKKLILHDVREMTKVKHHKNNVKEKCM